MPRFLRIDSFKTLRDRRVAQDADTLAFLGELDALAEKAQEGHWDACWGIVAAFVASYLIDGAYADAYVRNSYGVSPFDRMASSLSKALGSLYEDYESASLKAMSGYAQDVYLHACYEAQSDLGKWESVSRLTEPELSRLANSPWFDGNRFSDRLWADKDALYGNLYRTLTQGIAQGLDLKGMSDLFRRSYNAGAYVVKRLLRTEFNRLQNECLMLSYRDNGAERYEYVAILDERTTETCEGLNGQTFAVKDAEVGVNMPPMHPNCVLGDSIVFAPDAEKLIRSDYSGQIFKISTSDGRSLSVTPNHIMLTKRGWVRAKNLVKGDKVIRYLGWGEIAKVRPADYNGIPTVENLFASLIESPSVPHAVMPSSPKHLKGDSAENGEIHIVGIDGLLGNEIDSPSLELLSDCPLIVTDKMGEGALSGKRSVAEFLTCVGLAADGRMSGGSVSGIFLGGSLGHHQLVGLRHPSDYDARLLKSSFNDAVGNAEGLGDFINAIPKFVSFDDIVDIEIGYFSGHVYDISSMSTLYICNGYITSNCRSSTIPVWEGKLRVEGDAERLDYGQWLAKFVK